MEPNPKSRSRSPQKAIDVEEKKETKEFDRKNKNDNKHRDNKKKHRNSRSSSIDKLEIREKLPNGFEADLPNDLIKRENPNDKGYKVKLTISEKSPSINLNYGDNSKLIEKKNLISPHIEIWESKIKHLITDFELIDIYRPIQRAQSKYNQSIVNYEYGREKLSWIFSRAYFKLHEVITTYDVLKKFRGKKMNIACLAEGPGGFINCLIDFRNKQNESHSRMNKQSFWYEDNYHSITLKIPKDAGNFALDWDYPKSHKYFERMRKFGYKLNLGYGKGDGNMLKTENLWYFVNEQVKEKCELVTADGGIELKTDEQYALQELYNVKLFFSETITALACQKLEGTFIMKIYDSFFDITIDILVLLTQYYERVRITKPHTSRPASSERYVVCENFKGIKEDDLKQLFQCLEEWVSIESKFDYLENEKFVTKILEFEENDFPLFQKNLKDSNEDCINAQINKIEDGIKLVELKTLDQVLIRKTKKNQLEKATIWCKKHGIPYIKNLELSYD